MIKNTLHVTLIHAVKKYLIKTSPSFENRVIFSGMASDYCCCIDEFYFHIIKDYNPPFLNFKNE